MIDQLNGQDRTEYLDWMDAFGNSIREKIKLRTAQIHDLGLFPVEEIVRYVGDGRVFTEKHEAIYATDLSERRDASSHFLILPSGEMSVYERIFPGHVYRFSGPLVTNEQLVDYAHYAYTALVGVVHQALDQAQPEQ